MTVRFKLPVQRQVSSGCSVYFSTGLKIFPKHTLGFQLGIALVREGKWVDVVRRWNSPADGCWIRWKAFLYVVSNSSQEGVRPVVFQQKGPEGLEQQLGYWIEPPALYELRKLLDSLHTFQTFPESSVMRPKHLCLNQTNVPSFLRYNDRPPALKTLDSWPSLI